MTATSDDNDDHPKDADQAISVDSRRTDRVQTDRPFFVVLIFLLGLYVVLLAGMLFAQASYTTPGRIVEILSRGEVLASVRLSLMSATAATLAALIVGIPAAYLMSRYRFVGHRIVDAILDVPNVMPPLVLGLSLLILFQIPPLDHVSGYIVYQVPAVFLAQFVVASAYTIPILRSALDHHDPRTEKMALTLGCSRCSAFFRVTLPEIREGVLQAGGMSWARCLGTFGPLLVFAGATRNKTEVLATTIYLELSVGDLEASVAASILLIVLAGSVLFSTRWLVGKRLGRWVAGERIRD